MEFIYNSWNCGYKVYIFDGILHKIAENNHEITDEDMRILCQLFGSTLLKALELIDKEYIEMITIPNTDRSYFSVQGSNSFYTIYLNINFCQCYVYKFKVNLKKEKYIMCKHILACHLALATGKYKKRSASNISSSNTLGEEGKS